MALEKDLSVQLCGIPLKNPVIPASGTFGFGLELADTIRLDELGGISLKGTTREPRFGNPTPRIAECTAGMLNSVGLQNPGIDALADEVVPALRERYHGAVIANISGYSVEEYAHNCARADACPGIDLIEVNVSCPNVHGGGMAFGTDPDTLVEMLLVLMFGMGFYAGFVGTDAEVTAVVDKLQKLLANNLWKLQEPAAT